MKKSFSLLTQDMGLEVVEWVSAPVFTDSLTVPAITIASESFFTDSMSIKTEDSSDYTVSECHSDYSVTISAFFAVARHLDSCVVLHKTFNNNMMVASIVGAMRLNSVRYISERSFIR